MIAQQHTQPTAARMNTSARHYELYERPRHTLISCNCLLCLTICDHTMISFICHRKSQNISNYRLEMMPILLFTQALQTNEIHPKYSEFHLDMRNFCNFSLVLLCIRPCSRRCAERTRQGEGRWSRVPTAALERSYLTENSGSANLMHRPRQKKKLLTKSLKLKNDFIYMYMCVCFRY